MSLLNNNFIGSDGSPITGRVPTQLIVKSDPSSGDVIELTPALYSAVCHAYKLFCDAVRFSAFPDGYHVQNRGFQDGSKARFESNGGVHRAMVWPIGGGSGRYDIYPVAVFASYESRYGKYLEAGVVATVGSIFSNKKAGSVWANPPVGDTKGVDFRNYPKRLFDEGKLSASVPGNMDWSDRRDGSVHFGLVLSWWSLSVGRYATGPFYFTDSAGIYSTLGTHAIYEDYDAATYMPDPMRFVWCNGVAVAKLPAGMRVLSACLTEVGGESGYLRVVATERRYDTDTCQCFEVRVPHLAKVGKLTDRHSPVDFATSPLVETLWSSGGGSIFADNIGAAVFHANSSGSAFLVCGSTMGLAEVSTSTGGVLSTVLTPAAIPRVEGAALVAGNSTLNNPSALLTDYVNYSGSRTTQSWEIKRSLLAWDYAVDTPRFLYSQQNRQETNAISFSSELTLHTGSCSLTTSRDVSLLFEVKATDDSTVFSSSETHTASGTSAYTFSIPTLGDDIYGSFSDTGGWSQSGTLGESEAWVTGDLRVNCYDIHLKSAKSTQTVAESYEVSGASHIWVDAGPPSTMIFDPVVGLRKYTDASYLEDDCRTLVKVVSGAISDVVVRHNYSTVVGASGETSAPFTLRGQYGFEAVLEGQTNSSGLVSRVDQGAPGSWAGGGFPYRMGIRRDSYVSYFDAEYPSGRPREGASAIGFLPETPRFHTTIPTYETNGVLGPISSSTETFESDRFGFNPFTDNAAHTLGYTSSFDNRLIFRSVLHVENAKENLSGSDFSAEAEFINLQSGAATNLTPAVPDDFFGEHASAPTGVLLLGPIATTSGRYNNIPKIYAKEIP